MNVLSPDRKQSKVYAAAASYETHMYVCIYIFIYPSRTTLAINQLAYLKYSAKLIVTRSSVDTLR